MLLSKELTGNSNAYEKINNPLQALVVDCITKLSGVDKSTIEFGVDGCGVPVYATTLDVISKCFLKLTAPELIEDTPLRDAVTKLNNAIHQYPEMISGTDQLCTLLNMDDNIIANLVLKVFMR